MRNGVTGGEEVGEGTSRGAGEVAVASERSATAEKPGGAPMRAAVDDETTDEVSDDPDLEEFELSEADELDASGDGIGSPLPHRSLRDPTAWNN